MTNFELLREIFSMDKEKAAEELANDPVLTCRLCFFLYSGGCTGEANCKDGTIKFLDMERYV